MNLTTALKTLGLVFPYTEAQVREAFRSKSRVAHPDAGGDAGIFQELVSARQFLLNNVPQVSKIGGTVDGFAEFIRSTYGPPVHHNCRSTSKPTFDPRKINIPYVALVNFLEAKQQVEAILNPEQGKEYLRVLNDIKAWVKETYQH